MQSMMYTTALCLRALDAYSKYRTGFIMVLSYWPMTVGAWVTKPLSLSSGT